MLKYTFKDPTKKRRAALISIINGEYNKNSHDNKKKKRDFAISKKKHLNLLRIYRKNRTDKKSKHAIKILTDDMKFLDKKYHLERTNKLLLQNEIKGGGNLFSKKTSTNKNVDKITIPPFPSDVPESVVIAIVEDFSAYLDMRGIRHNVKFLKKKRGAEYIFPRGYTRRGYKKFEEGDIYMEFERDMERERLYDKLNDIIRIRINNSNINKRRMITALMALKRKKPHIYYSGKLLRRGLSPYH